MDKELKLILDRIIEQVYKDKDNSIINSYKKFIIVLSRKETKINENYKDREITIYNLYRTESEITNSLLIGLAHHIDFCHRGYTNNKKEFFNFYKTLINYALSSGYLSYDNLISSNDFKNIKRIRDVLEDYWIEKQPSDKCKIEVFGSYAIKQNLKNMGFTFSYLGKCWYKIVNNNDVKVLIEDLKKIEEKIPIYIVNENKVSINISARIVVSGDSFFIKELLKKNGYRFIDKCWKKSINASDYLFEKKLIQNIIPEGQGIRISIEF